MGGEWPLVGRQQELEALRAALGAADSGGMLVAGPAGVGKTRLARAAMADLAGVVDCEWVMATHASRSIPFGALAHLLSTPSDAAASWSGQDRFELLHAAIGAVKERTGGGRRLVLGVDDAHLLDEGAATLIQQLAVTGTVQVVLTTRAGEPTPDPVVALWKDGLIGRLELRPLAPADVGELLVAVLGGQVEQRTLTRLWSTSGGNALFLKELVLGAVDDETLARKDGIWLWRGQVRARFVEKTAFLGFGRGKIALLRGKPATAARWLREAVMTLGEFDPGHIRPWAECMLAEALALTGEVAEARQLVVESNSRPVAGLYEGDLRRARAWPAHAEGRRSDAVDLAMEAADWCRADGQFGIELHALHDALRLGGVTVAAARLAARCEGACPPALAALG